MRGRSRAVQGAAAVAAVVLAALLAATARTSAAPPPGAGVPGGHPLRTGIIDAEDARTPAELARVRAAGISVIRISVFWSAVAPGPSRPSGFDAADPQSPHYRWTLVDQDVTAARASGLDVIVSIHTAPPWADRGAPRTDGGPFRPDPEELASFARAAATRYSGRLPGLPRVRYWQVWNEPNLSFSLNPQLVAGRPASPVWYRSMVNAFAGAVKSVHRDNLVVAGGLAPIARFASRAVSPLAFMRSMLCLSRAGRPTCRATARFDVWSHHPYTTGGPTHQAFRPDDVALGDLPEMRQVLVAAYRARRIAAPRAPLFWVTEFSWDSKPPDPRGVPLGLHARWVSEALFRMWTAGVSLVTWFSLQDRPYGSDPFQSGLYFRGFRPKPALQAFRFPFVAFRERDGRVLVWGRTPRSDRRRLAVEQRGPTGWRRVSVLSSNAHGIFSARVSPPGRGPLRAALLTAARTGEASRAFSLVVPPDRYVRPFG